MHPLKEALYLKWGEALKWTTRPVPTTRTHKAHNVLLRIADRECDWHWDHD